MLGEQKTVSYSVSAGSLVLNYTTSQSTRFFKVIESLINIINKLTFKKERFNL